jgi:hypothetical protein
LIKRNNVHLWAAGSTCSKESCWVRFATVSTTYIAAQSIQNFAGCLISVLQVSLSCQTRPTHIVLSDNICSRPVTYAVLQAALALTTNLDPSVPTIAFLITDAPPHLTTDDPSPTNTHEMRFLQGQCGLSEQDASDFFKCFCATALSHFGSNLILNCVVYNTDVFTAGPAAPPSATQRLYGSLAQQTGGMLMEPDSSRDSSVLARGLTAVVRKLIARMQGVRLPAGSYRHPQQQRLQQLGLGQCGAGGYGMPGMLGRYMAAGGNRAAAVGGASQQLEDDDDGFELRGFKLVDVSSLNVQRSCETDEEGRVAYGDREALFEIAMKRMVGGEAAAAI